MPAGAVATAIRESLPQRRFLGLRFGRFNPSRPEASQVKVDVLYCKKYSEVRTWYMEMFRDQRETVAQRK